MTAPPADSLRLKAGCKLQPIFAPLCRETLPSTRGQEKEGGERSKQRGGSVVWLLLLVSKQSFPTLTRATNLRGEGKKEGNNSSLSHLPSTALHFDCFSQCFPLPFSFAPLVQIPFPNFIPPPPRSSFEMPLPLRLLQQVSKGNLEDCFYSRFFVFAPSPSIRSVQIFRTELMEEESKFLRCSSQSILATKLIVNCVSHTLQKQAKKQLKHT